MKKSHLQVLTACLLLLVTSCKKNESLESSEKPLSVEAKLFDLTGVSEKSIITLASEIKRQGIENNFLDFFLENNGVPLWSKSLQIEENENSVVIVPIEKNESKVTAGFIVARKNKGKAHSISFYKRDLLKQYRFYNYTNLNAYDVQLLLNHFDRKLFNAKTAKLHYTMQIPDHIRRKHIGNLSPEYFGLYLSEPDPVEVETLTRSCISIETGFEWTYDPDGTSDHCHCSGNETRWRATVVKTFCVGDPGPGSSAQSGGSFGQDGWWTGNPMLGPNGNPNGGGPGQYFTVEDKLIGMLQPGDSYYFMSTDPNSPMEPWDEDPVNYPFVESFESAIKDYQLLSAEGIDLGNQKTIRNRVNRTTTAGYNLDVRIQKNSSNIFEVTHVWSEEVGFTNGWSWTQSGYTVTSSGNVTTVDVTGVEKYSLILENIGTIYRRDHKYRILIDNVNGTVNGFEKL